MAAPVLSAEVLVVMVVSAFVLPLVFLWWIRNTQRYRREPMGMVLWTFFAGAIVSVLVAIVLSLVVLNAALQVVPLYLYLANRFKDPATVLGVLVVAPFVEEASKGLAVLRSRRTVHAPTDGLVYGAAAGLGFSATENLFYGLAGLLNPGLGVTGSLVLIAVRSFSSSLLHASSTATTGYGLAKSWLKPSRWTFLPFYLIAVAMHASFNFLSSYGQLYSVELGPVGDYIGFAAAVLFAVVAITIVRFKLAQRRPAVAR